MNVMKTAYKYRAYHLGIEKYATLSDNTVYQNAKITKHHRNHAKVLQQGISRKSQACGDDVRPSAWEAVAGEAGTLRVAS
ncbi:MAG: hypothetical protein QXK65_02225 [Candidatus Micrarchaeaceae archaeon]